MAVYNFLGGTWSSTFSWAGGVVPPNADTSRIVFNSSSGDVILTGAVTTGGIRFDGTTASSDAEFGSFLPATDYYAGTFNLNNTQITFGGSTINNKVYFSPDMKWVHGGSNGRINFFTSGNHGNLRLNGMTMSVVINWANSPKTLEDDMIYNLAGSDGGGLHGFANAVRFQGVSGTRKNIYIHFWGLSQSTKPFTPATNQGPAKFLSGEWMNLIYSEHNGTLTNADFRFFGVSNGGNFTEASTIFDFGIGTMSGSIFDISGVVEYKSGNLVNSNTRFQGDFNTYWAHSSTSSFVPNFTVAYPNVTNQDCRVNAVGNQPFCIQNLYIQPTSHVGANSIFTIGGLTTSAYPTLPLQSWSCSTVTIGGDISANIFDDSPRLDFRMGRGATLSTDYLFTNYSVLRSGSSQKADWNVASLPASGPTPSISVKNESVIYNTSIQNINFSGPETVYGLTAMSITGDVGDYQDGLPTGGGGSTETSHTFIL